MGFTDSSVVILSISRLGEDIEANLGLINCFLLLLKPTMATCFGVFIVNHWDYSHHWFCLATKTDNIYHLYLSMMAYILAYAKLIKSNSYIPKLS